MKELFAFIVATILGLVAFTRGMPLLRGASDRPFEDSAATMQSQVTDAAVDYVRTFFGTLLTATAGGVAEVTPAMLRATGKLDPAFVDGDWFGQTHSVMVRQLSATQLQIAVATCGGTIPDDTLFRLAPQAGKYGGIISTADPATIRGAVGGWAVPVAAFGGGTAGCPLSAGSLVSVVYFDNGAVLTPYLSRLPMPEFGAEPNTMGTTLSMGGHTVENAQDLQLSSGTWLSSAIMATDIVQDGATIAKQSCPHGTPSIDVAPVVFSGPNTGLPLIGVQAHATDNGGSWTVHLDIYTVAPDGSGTVAVPSGPQGRALVMERCR